MQKKLSTVAICAVVAVVAFFAGTMFSSAIAQQRKPNVKILGVVDGSYNGAYVVYEQNGEYYHIRTLSVPRPGDIDYRGND